MSRFDFFKWGPMIMFVSATQTWMRGGVKTPGDKAALLVGLGIGLALTTIGVVRALRGK